MRARRPVLNSRERLSALYIKVRLKEQLLLLLKKVYVGHTHGVHKERTDFLLRIEVRSKKIKANLLTMLGVFVLVRCIVMSSAALLAVTSIAALNVLDAPRIKNSHVSHKLVRHIKEAIVTPALAP